jgi:hypothetical protein
MPHAITRIAERPPKTKTPGSLARTGVFGSQNRWHKKRRSRYVLDIPAEALSTSPRWLVDRGMTT